MPLHFTRLLLVTCLIFSWFGCRELLAQGTVYEIDEHFTIVDCEGTFVDDGGPLVPHDAAGVEEITICSNSSDPNSTHISLNFSQLFIAGTLEIFDDSFANPASLIATFTDADNGDNPVVSASISNPSGCLTIRFTPNGSDVGWNAFISCIKACQPVEAALLASDPAVMPADTGTIDICPGDRVFFTGTGLYPQDGLVYDQDDATSTFEWNFNDGGMAEGNEVSHVFSDPGIFVVQLYVTDTEGCNSLNLINQQVRVSPGPVVTFQENLEDSYCIGETIDLTQSTEYDADASTNLFIETQPIFTPVSQTFADTIALPDGNGGSFLSQLNFNNFIAGQTVNSADDIVSVCLNMEHSYAGDLDIQLICGDPDGVNQTIEFLPWPNGMGGTYLGEPIDDETLNPGIGYDYCFTADADETWQEADGGIPFGESLPAGDYLPAEGFDGMIGCPLNGDWYIRISDNLNIDDGWLFSWTITFADELYPDRDSINVGIDSVFWNDNPDLIYYSSDSIVTTPTAAGANAYVLSVVDSFGCEWDTTVVANMLPFSDPDCYECQPMLDQVLQQDTICGQADVQTELASIERIDTAIQWQAYEDTEFGQPLFPNLANALESTINVSTIRPAFLNNIAQIESVCVNIETDFAGDINLFLRSPDGSILELSTGNGAGGDDYVNTCFTPDAITPITAAGPPFTGEFQPEGDWNALTLGPTNGSWTLIAFDDTGIQLGRFINWTISFVHQIELDYNWTPDDGNLSCTDCPDPVISADQTQTYEVSVTDDYGCMEMGEVQIFVVDQLPPLIPTCENGAPGSGELTFSWNPSSPSGQYEYTVDTGSGPSAPTTVNDTFVTITGLSNQQGVVFNVRPFITDQAQLDCVDNTFITINCTYLGCIFSATLEQTTDISCFGADDGTATISLTDNDGLLDFTLNGNPATLTDGMLTDLEPGMYQLVATDPTSCADTLNFSIDEPDEVEASVMQTDILCNGALTGQIIVAGDGGTGTLMYALDDGDMQVDQTFAGLSAATYSVTVIDENNCSFDTTITISEPTPVLISSTLADTRCSDTQDGSIDLMVSGGTPGYTYDWADLPGDDNGEDRTLLPPNTYVVTITDNNGCESVREETIGAPDAIELALVSIDSVDCFGGGNGAINITPDGGTGDLDFLWDDPNAQFEASAVFLTAGTYTLVATDENGCTETVMHTVGEPTPLTIDFDRQNVSCRDESTGSATAMPAGGNGDFTYSWDTGTPGQSITNQPAGVYTVTVTDRKGCTLIDSIQLTEPATAVSLDVSQDIMGCFEASLNEASVMAMGGAGNYSYLWSNGQMNATASNLPGGTATVAVTDGAGCTVEQSIELVDLEEITFNLITMMPSCNGLADGGMGINQLTGGAGNIDDDYSFEWSTGSQNIVAENLVGGVTYSVTVTDAQGCQGTRELTLPDPAPVSFETFTSDVSCFGFTDGEAGINNISGPNPGEFSITWSDNTGGSAEPSVTNLPAGAYSVLVTDALGCTQNANLVITQPAAIQGTLTTQDATCSGDADGQVIADINGGTPGYTYSWSNNLGDGPSVNNLPAGEYELLVTDANNCEFTVRATIEEPEAVIASVMPQDVLCAGDATGRIIVSGEGGRPPFTFSLDGQSFSRSEQFLGLTAGEYTVFVRDAGGCIATTQASVVDGPAFDISLGLDTTIIFGDSIMLEALINGGIGMLDYFWQGSYDGTLNCDTCPVVTVKPEFEIDYELLVIDENGCEAEDRVRVRVEKIKVVEVPTGFTPNADNRNDLLLVHGRPGTLVNYFRVFDRWGQTLYEDGEFEVNDATRGWDGTYQGDPLNGGVFLWQVEVTYEDGTNGLLTGQTTLIR